MSDHAETFIAHLIALKEKDHGAMAVLRHSLAFEPGAYVKAFAHVERFAKASWHDNDARRLALYAVAGLFASHPKQRARSFAEAFGDLMRLRSSPGQPNKSIEGRFVALLGADAENVVDYLRQAVSLLKSADIGFDYAALLDDLFRWMSPAIDPKPVRQRWARAFYRAAQATPESIDAE